MGTEEGKWEQESIALMIIAAEWLDDHRGDFQLMLLKRLVP